MIIDKTAYKSKLRNISPWEKTVFALAAMLICIFADNILISTVTTVTMLSVVIFAGKTNFKTVFHLMTIPAVFIMLSCAAILISVSKDSGGLIFCIRISDIFIGIGNSSIISALRTLSKCFGAVSCMYFLSLTTPMTDIFILLRKSPVPKFITEITELIYRYIFVLSDTCRKIHISQQSRLGYSNLKTKYRSTVLLVSNLFMCSMHQAEKTFTALESRGYNGTINVLERKYIHSKSFIFLSAVYILLISALTFILKAVIK